MAVKIQIKRGTKAGLPALSPGEYGLATDTGELFIGGANGNIQVATLGSDGKIPGGNLDLSNVVSHSEEELGAVLPVDADTLGGIGPDGYVPVTRTVNGKPLDADITLTAGDVGAATTATYTATIPASGWSGSGPYTVAVTVSGILASDNPIADIVQTGTESTDEAIRENWGKINRITTAAGSVTVYASEVPSAGIPIQLKVVR